MFINMSKYYLGIDLGGTDIKVGVIDEDYKILAKHVVSTLSDRSIDDVIADMAAAGKAAVKMAGLMESDIVHVGVGVPGTVNSRTNEIVFANNIGWRNVDFIPLFQKYWNIPAYLGNDADAAVLAEVYAGVAKDYDNVILLTLGTGVGGGFVFDKKLFTGNGLGTEPGHIIIVVDGEQCTCGSRGCFEAYASVTGLIRDAKLTLTKFPDSLLNKLCSGDTSKINGRMIFDALNQSDEATSIVVERYVKYLGTGIASLCNALRPQAVILGGGVCNAGEALFEPVRKVVESLVYFTDYGGLPPIIKAELGNDAGLIGAALFGVDRE
jgi:glucokinase